MKKFLLAVLLLLATTAQTDTKISQLPLGNAATTGPNDSFPYVNATAGVTERLDLSDLLNLPSLSVMVRTNRANTYTSGPQSLGSQVQTIQLTNDTSTGTTANKLAKLTSIGRVVITATSDTSGVVGIVVAGAGLSGSSDIAQVGQAACVFDGATTAGDYVQISSITAGDCHDSGASLPTSGQAIGRVLSTNVGAGTYNVVLFMPSVAGSGGAGTVSSVAMSVPAWLSVAGSPITGSGTLAVTGTSESQNLFLASPNGSSGAMTPRSIVGADLPTGNLTDAGTDGITVTGGSSSVIGAGTSLSQHVSDTTHAGYLSSADWNTFNGKQNTVSFGAVGAAPNANAGGISAGVITLEPFDSTHPGVVTASGGGTTNFLRADGSWAVAGAGTVTAVSVASANGFAGTSSGGSTPALTLSTSITGVLKGNGTAISSSTSSDIIGLFSTCSGTQYLGADGACHTPSAGFTNPMTTLGDIMYEDVTPTAARLAGNTTSTKQYLSQTGTGAVSAVPAWSQPAFSELSGTATVAQGGTGLGSITAHNLIVGNGTSNVTLLPPGGTSGIPLCSQGVGVDPAYCFLSVSAGGTGQVTFGANSVLLGNGTGGIRATATSTAGIPLISGGTGVDPSFTSLSLSGAGVTGSLPTSNGGLGGNFGASTGALSISSGTVSAGTLATVNGGTGLSSPTAGAIPITNGASAMTTVASGTAKNIIVDTGTTWASDAPETINFVQNAGAEISGLNIPTAFADGGTTTPVNLSGGSPNTTCTRTTSSPLDGAASFLMTINSGASRQGEGCAWTITIPPAYQLSTGNSISVYFPFATTGTLLSTDVQIWAYDVTNTSLIYPTWISPIVGTSGIAIAQFPIKSNTASIRVANYIARTSTGAATIEYDDVRLAPLGNQVTGIQASDWTSYTPTFAGFGSVTGINMFHRRVGDSDEIAGTFTTGAVSGVTAKMSLPAGETIDTTKMAGAANQQNVGVGAQASTGAGSSFSIITSPSITTTDLYFTTLAFTGVNPLVAATGSALGASSTYYSLYAKVPIVGWSAQQNIVTAQSFNISNYLASGTRVTTTPTVLGQYRCQYRATGNSGTLTDTAPTNAPSSSNGMQIYGNVAFTAGGTSGQCTTYQIYVGTGKSVQIYFWQSAGKTGSLDASPFQGTSTANVGATKSYDSATGVVTVDASWAWTGSETSRSLGITPPGGGTVGLGYFDILVSPNALPVAANTRNVWSGYQDGITGGCANSSATYADVSACTNIAIHQINTQNMVCSQASGSAAGITCTFPNAGLYDVKGFVVVSPQGTGGRWGARVVDGSGTVISPGTGFTNLGVSASTTVPFSGSYYVALPGTTATLKVQLSNNNGVSLQIDEGPGTSGTAAMNWYVSGPQ